MWEFLSANINYVVSFLVLALTILSCLVIYVIKSNKNISFGKLKINGKPLSYLIKECIRLEMLKVEASKDGKNEQRSIVKEGVSYALNLMRHSAIATILSKSKDENCDVKEYSTISEIAIPYTVAKIMESVDRNHYADRSEEAWTLLKQDLFNKVFTYVESFFIDRFESCSISITDISDGTKANIEVYKQVFNTTMDRCRQVAKNVKLQQSEIDIQIAGMIQE